MYKVGDRFVIEIRKVHPRDDDHAWYTIKGFDTPLKDDELGKLEQIASNEKAAGEKE